MESKDINDSNNLDDKSKESKEYNIVYKKVDQIGYIIGGKEESSSIIEILPEELAKALREQEMAKRIKFVPKSPTRRK